MEYNTPTAIVWSDRESFPTQCSSPDFSQPSLRVRNNSGGQGNEQRDNFASFLTQN